MGLPFYKSFEEIPFEGGSFYAHVKKWTEMEQIISYAFYRRFPFWEALYDHITKDGALIEDQAPKDKVIVYHRGTGASIRFKEIRIYDDYDRKTKTETERVSLCIVIGFVDELADPAFALEQEYTFYLEPPVKLIKNFSQKGFDEWVKTVKKRKEVESEEEDRALLARLAKRFPGAINLDKVQKAKKSRRIKSKGRR